MGRQEVSETRMTSPVYWQEDGKSALATHPDLGPAIPPAAYVPSHKSLATDQLLPLDGRNDFPQDVSTTAQCYPQQRWTAERPGPSDRDAALRDLSGAEQDSVRTLATTSSGAARKGDRARGGSWAEHASLMSAGNHRQVISIVHKESVYDEPGDGHGGDDPSALSLIIRHSLLVPLISIPAAIYALLGLLVAVLTNPLRLCTPNPVLRNTTFHNQLCTFLSPALHLHERIAGIRNPLQQQQHHHHHHHHHHPNPARTQTPTAADDLTPSTPVDSPTQRYSGGGLFLILILSPLLSVALLLGIWIAAFFWLFTMVLGDSDGSGRKDDDGRAAVFGIRKWWRSWLSKATRGGTRESQ